MDARRIAWYHCKAGPASLTFQTWYLRRVALYLFWEMGLLRKSLLLKEGPWPFPRPIYELMGNCVCFCCFCYLTLVHKQDVKYSNSSDRANCANSWQANWGPLSVITVAWIPCQRPSFPAVSNRSCCSGAKCIQGKSQEWRRSGFPRYSWQMPLRNPNLLCLQPSNDSCSSQNKCFS